MRKSFLLLSLFVFSTLACNTVMLQSRPTAMPTRVPQTEADVPRVSVKDAKAAFDSGQAVIVDVRSAEAFAAEHIDGSINIPLADIESNPAGVNLDKNQWIITYCT